MSIRPRAVDRGGTSPPVIALIPALPAPPSIPLPIKPAPATVVALQRDAGGVYRCPWCHGDAEVGRYHTRDWGCDPTDT